MKELTTKLLDDLSSLAAIGWTDAELAGFLDITERQLDVILADPVTIDDQRISNAIKRGQLEKRAKIELAVVRGAMGGDADSVEQFRDIVRDKSFTISKLDLFGGAEKKARSRRFRNILLPDQRATFPTRNRSTSTC